MNLTKWLSLFLCFLFITCVIDGCKEKGCTDKKALNFNSLAKKDDGSCKYCISTIEVTGSRYYWMIDHNHSSLYYNQKVVGFTLTQNKEVFNDKGCGEGNCTYTLTMENLIHREMEFDYRFTFSTFGSELVFDKTGHEVLNASVNTVNDIEPSASTNICAEIFNGSIDMKDITDITYH